MITYIKLGRIRGLAIELKKDFSARPFFQKNNFHYETIIDIPYAQITYTSGKWFPAKRRPAKKVSIRSVSNGNKQTGKIRKRAG